MMLGRMELLMVLRRHGFRGSTVVRAEGGEQLSLLKLVLVHDY